MTYAGTLTRTRTERTSPFEEDDFTNLSIKAFKLNQISSNLKLINIRTDAVTFARKASFQTCQH